jgi:hypothetical protein
LRRHHSPGRFTATEAETQRRPSRAPQSSASPPPAAEDITNGQSLTVTAAVSLAASDQRIRPGTRSASSAPSQLIHSSLRQSELPRRDDAGLFASIAWNRPPPALRRGCCHRNRSPQSAERPHLRPVCASIETDRSQTNRIVHWVGCTRSTKAKQIHIPDPTSVCHPNRQKAERSRKESRDYTQTVGSDAYHSGHLDPWNKSVPVSMRSRPFTQEWSS